MRRVAGEGAFPLTLLDRLVPPPPACMRELLGRGSADADAEFDAAVCKYKPPGCDIDTASRPVVESTPLDPVDGLSSAEWAAEAEAPSEAQVEAGVASSAPFSLCRCGLFLPLFRPVDSRRW